MYPARIGTTNDSLIAIVPIIVLIGSLSHWYFLGRCRNAGQIERLVAFTTSSHMEGVVAEDADWFEFTILIIRS